MSPSISLDSLPTGMWVALIVLAVVQVTLEVVALVDLVRRPREQVAMLGKVPWAVIIVLVNTVGAVLYLIIGRTKAPAAPPETTAAFAGGTANGSVADSLYGASPSGPVTGGAYGASPSGPAGSLYGASSPGPADAAYGERPSPRPEGPAA